MHVLEPTTCKLRILVTGAAGLIGREVCAVLAGRGHAVTGFVRRRAAPRTQMPQAIRRVEGDIAEPLLGLTAGLAAQLDLIVHCAAVTGFSLPDATYQRINTGGAANVLGFARSVSPPVPVLHVSTAYVCGAAEGVVAEAPATPARFNNGYEASKAAAEALVLASRGGGQIAAIARPSIVVGRWTDGSTDTFGSIYHLIRLVAEGRIRVLPACAGASLDLVPLDYVVSGLVDIAEHMVQADGQVFHLAAGCPVPLAALARVADHFPHLQTPRFLPPGQFRPSVHTARDRWLQEQVIDAYACYLRPSPRFATANLAALTGRRCPPVDAAYLRRLVAHAVSAGLLPAARASGPADTADRAAAVARAPSAG